MTEKLICPDGHNLDEVENIDFICPDDGSECLVFNDGCGWFDIKCGKHNKWHTLKILVEAEER